MTTLILMSKATVREKLSILYDLFDWAQGSHEGLKLQSVIAIVKTIQQRNLYFMPDHELFNSIEFKFTGTVSQVYRALWTRKGRVLEEQGYTMERREKTAQDNTPQAEISKDIESVEVTRLVQEAFTHYLQVFGTKVIDFNPDVSAFNTLSKLVGHEMGRKLLAVSKAAG